MRMYERRRTCTCVASESRHLEFPLALWTSHLHDALVSHSTKPKTTEGTTHEDLLFQPASHSISQYVPSLLLFPLVEWAWRCNFISHWRFSPGSGERFSVTQGSPYNRGAYANSSSTHNLTEQQLFQCHTLFHSANKKGNPSETSLHALKQIGVV